MRFTRRYLRPVLCVQYCCKCNDDPITVGSNVRLFTTWPAVPDHLDLVLLVCSVAMLTPAVTMIILILTSVTDDPVRAGLVILEETQEQLQTSRRPS